MDCARRHTTSDDNDVVAHEEDGDDDDPGDDDPGDDDPGDDAYFLARRMATFLDPDAGLMGNDLADWLGLCRDVLNFHDALLRANDDSEEEDGRI